MEVAGWYYNEMTDKALVGILTNNLWQEGELSLHKPFEGRIHALNLVAIPVKSKTSGDWGCKIMDIVVYKYEICPTRRQRTSLLDWLSDVICGFARRQRKPLDRHFAGRKVFEMELKFYRTYSSTPLGLVFQLKNRQLSLCFQFASRRYILQLRNDAARKEYAAG